MAVLRKLFFDFMSAHGDAIIIIFIQYLVNILLHITETRGDIYNSSDP